MKKNKQYEQNIPYRALQDFYAGIDRVLVHELNKVEEA